MLESIIHGGQKVAHSRIAVRCRAWILSWRRKENHSFHLDSSGLFGSQEESLKHQLCIYFYIQVFVLHLLSLSFFFFVPFFASRDCWYPTVCVCWLYQPSCCDTHLRTGCLPHHPSQTDTGPAWHLNSTEGTALGSINMHDSIIGYAQTHTRTCTFTHVCAFCIHVQEVLMHTRTAQCIQTCSHTHTHSYSHY